MNGASTPLLAVKMLLGLLPVCVFLVSLIYLDSYKLVRLRTLLQLMLAGAMAGVLSYVISRAIGAEERELLMRLTGPVLEEVLKAIPIILMLRTRRAGFLVDAAIFGFAVGTGFALIENLYYLAAVPHAPVALWVVRGFGTAVMHAGTTAIVAIMTKALSDRRGSTALRLAIPGVLAAIVVHSLFNHFFLSPLVTSVVIMIVLPPVLILVFAQSERYLQSWLGSGFDLDAELLRAIQSGEFGLSRPGRYLQSLREHFEGPVVVDMLCYIRLEAELSLRAKGMLMLRENGFAVKKDAAVEAKLAEMRYLRQSIGKTGELALAPVLQRSSRELWQLYMLETSG